MVYAPHQGSFEKYCGLLEPDIWRDYLGEVVLKLHCLITHHHRFSPFFVIFSQEADPPSLLRCVEAELNMAGLKPEHLLALAEEFAQYIL